MNMILPPSGTSAILAAVLTISIVIHLLLKRHRKLRFLAKNTCQATGPSYPLSRFLFGFDFLLENTCNVFAHKFAEGVHSRFELYGTTHYAYIALKNVIMTIEPENLECMMKTRFDHYTIIPARRKLTRTLFGEGIFAAAGREWYSSRRLVRLSMPRLARSNLAIFDKHAQAMVERIRLIAPEQTFDFREIAFRYTLAVATILIVGISPEEEDGEEAVLNQFGVDFSFLNRISASLTIFNNQIPYLANILYGKKFAGARDRVFDVVESHARQALQERASEKSAERPRSVVEGLAKQTTDVKQIRSECLNLLLAGHSVGNSFSELFYCLARNPAVWSRLREEIAILEGRIPTFAELKGLMYLKWCINEMLRIRPALSVHARVAICDTVMPRGGGEDGIEPLMVEKGTYCVYSQYSLNRSTGVFGEDVDVFRPERWANISPGRFEYLDFGAGPRSCPGKEMGWTLIAFATVKLAQNFERISTLDDKPWEEAVSFSFYNRNGVHLSMVPAV